MTADSGESAGIHTKLGCSKEGKERKEQTEHEMIEKAVEGLETKEIDNDHEMRRQTF